MKLDTFELASPELGNSRKIRVLHPDEDGFYPVLYVHDGAFCFRKDTPPESECLSIDKVLERKNLPLIVVSIEAMDWMARTKEYSPFPWVGEAEPYLKSGEEKGMIYLDWIVKSLMPCIARRYKTKTDCPNTYMLGCSLGAQMSVYASARCPDVFSKIGCFSLADWGNEEAFLDFLRKAPLPVTTSYFIRVGTEEGRPRNMASLGECYEKISRNLAETLLEKGIRDLDFKVNEGRHHKTAEWEKDIPSFIDWLLKD